MAAQHLRRRCVPANTTSVDNAGALTSDDTNEALTAPGAPRLCAAVTTDSILMENVGADNTIESAETNRFVLA